MFGDNFKIKLIDFGFSRQQNPNLDNKTQLGTQGYMAPQIIRGMNYDGKKADVFALGVCIFSIATGQPPFVNADPSQDAYYSCFIQNFDYYWNKQRNQSLREKADPKLIQLIQKTLCLDENERWSMEQILECEFLQRKIDLARVEQEIKSIVDQQSKNHFINEDSDLEFSEDEGYRDNSQRVMLEYNQELDKIETQKVSEMTNGFVMDSNSQEMIHKVYNFFDSLDEIKDIAINTSSI